MNATILAAALAVSLALAGILGYRVVRRLQGRRAAARGLLDELHNRYYQPGEDDLADAADRLATAVLGGLGRHRRRPAQEADPAGRYEQYHWADEQPDHYNQASWRQ